MEFTIKTGNPAKLKTGLLVLGAFADGKLPALGGAVATMPRKAGSRACSSAVTSKTRRGPPCCSTSSRARTPNACWW